MKKDIKVIDGNLHYTDVNLYDLVQKYGTPLRVTFLDIIKERVQSLKCTYDKVIKQENYKSKFIYVNANKANYECLEIETAYSYSDGLECSSYYDLLVSIDIIKNLDDSKSKYIICNGFKEKNYIDKIIELAMEGYNIINIIDSLEEYKYLVCNTKLTCNTKSICKVGLRVHLPSLYHEENDIIANDRFGLMKDEFDYIINDIVNHPFLELNTIHFHQRGFDYDKDKFTENIKKVFNEYYVFAARKINTVSNFNMGGGTPLPARKSFDYEAWARYLIKLMKELCNEHQIDEPNIISENGKYSQKDSTVNIYEVVGVKKTDEIPWYIINGSLLIAMPEMYALGEEIDIYPVTSDNLVKARLASISCDCDDIFYDKELGYIMLPEKKENKVYVAIIATGSYQNSMAGKGGIHHCLIPQEKDLVINKVEGKYEYFVREEVQSIEAIKKLMHIKNKKH